MEKTLIADGEDRNNAGVKFFTNVMQWIEAQNFAFDVAWKYVEGYSGGLWDYYETKNGAFFMSPQADEKLKWSNPDNYSEGEISAEALGIIACLYAFSHMSFRHQDNEAFGNQYHKLRESIYKHPEASMIFRAID